MDKGFLTYLAYNVALFLAAFYLGADLLTALIIAVLGGAATLWGVVSPIKAALYRRKYGRSY